MLREAENIQIYRSLYEVVQLAWNTRKLVQPNNRAARILAKGLKKNFIAISGKHSIDALQNVAIL
jgi:hypothetical protein